MICPYCKKEAIWCENKVIYGRNHGKSYMCYYCLSCDAYVGCHRNTKKALGTMANRELREWRKKAHSIIDPFWKSGKYTRKKVYYLLGNIHVGESDIEQCKLIIDKAKILESAR